ncbi:MAG: T9SS type A sorting domain-containing protein, partial [Saprospiraceae bacterium]|nr:T9SS type A sorting domain-containing protein [Saprospiraceae bacterium]
GVQIKITYQSTTTQFEKTVDTDAQGMWRVDSLKPGTYDLELTIPQGFSMSPKMLGNDRMIDSDFDDLGKLQISLTSGIDQFDIDAGLISEAKNSVGNLVWDDLNGNGIQDNGEPGIQFMTVDLIGTSTTGQNITLSTQTDFNGNYNFSNLPDGEYQIFVHRFNYTYFTFKNIGDPTKDSNIDPVTEMSEKFTLSGGQSRTDIDAGLYQLGALGDYVWVDEDQDGIQSPSEVGLEGVELILFDGQNNFISSVTTGFGGFYFFSDLIPGTYYIEAMLPQGYTATTPHQSFDSEDSDFEISGTRVITPFLDVISGMNNTNVDLGIFIQKTQISGFTWIDENGDGQFEGNDKKIANLLVTLVDMNNAIISTQITNEDGEYLFENLNPNEYKVKFAATDSLSITYFQLGDPELDSDIEIFPEFSTGIINLSIGDNLTGVNGGFARFSSIGDYVWIDKNEDGIQNNQEVGLNGVLVKLFDEVGTLVDSTYTAIPAGSNSGGFYTFDSLYFGNYYVQFSTVNNFKFSNKYASTPDVNSNADATGLTTVFSLPPSTQLDSIDAGYIILAPVTSNIEGVVWKDVNNNLVKDPSESILSGVLIDLYDINNILIASTTSGVDGTYKFSNIPFGDYYIKSQKFSDKLFVPYSGFSVPNDSEFTGSFGEGTTRIINLFPGITMTDFDLGYADKITIGDFVWLDANNNGLQDSGEQGFPNVMISLYNQSGQKIKEVTSNANGGYVFNEIPTGKYNVIFQNLDGYMFAIFNSTNNQTNSKADPKTGQTGLTDYLGAGNYTNVDAGYVVEGTIGDFAWLDLNGNGYQNINEPGISGILIKLFKADGTFVDSTRTQVNASTDMDGFYEFHKVRPGNYYVKMEFPSQYLLSQALVGDTISDSNITKANGPYTTDTFTLDLGEHRTDIDGAAYLPATLGDLVWNDINKNGIQDAGEPGLSGVIVELYTQSNTLVGRDTTDSSGLYRFGGLKQRLYYLQFRILDGFEFTLQNVGNPSFDSDVDATGTTPLISLAHGATFLDIDAGMYVSSARLVMGTLWYDKNENGIRDEGEPLQKSITTYLKNSAEQTVKSFVTNHAGMYCLSTKVYGEHYVFISLPDDNVFTQKGVGSSSMNSDFNADGSSDMFMLKPGISMQYIDGGYFEKNTTDLSGTVWLDTNPNGIKDDNDTKMKDVVLLCFDKQRNFIKSTKSDDNGLYTFRDLDPGEYYCLLPYYEDKTFIMNTGTQTDNDSEFTNAYGIGTSRLVTLSGNDPTINFDFGYRSKTSQERAQSKSTVEIPDVYPNPALHTIYLENNNGNLNDYQIVSPNGEVLRTGTFIVGKNSIDIESLKGGQYYLIINVADGIVVKPIIKANY